MRVLYIVGGNGKGYGSEKVAQIAISELSSKYGVEFVVVVSHKGYISDYCESNNIECYEVDYHFYVYKKEKKLFLDIAKRFLRIMEADYYDNKAIHRIEKLVDLKSIDIIHTNLSRNLLGGKIANKYGIPHVWHIQELYSGHYGLSLLKYNQIAWMNKHASVFLAVSNSVRNGWREAGLRDEKLEMLYNTVDSSRIVYKENYNSFRSTLKIIMVGELCEEKGQALVVEALSRIPSIDRKAFSVGFYGDGKKDYVESLKHLCKKNKIQASFLGYSNRIGETLYTYDIGVVCSKGEGFGLSTLEFMVAGLCVIASNSGANTELIENEETGFVFDRNDLNSLTCILERILNHPEMIEHKGKKAREKAIALYSTDLFSDALYTNYINAIEKNIKTPAKK